MLLPSIVVPVVEFLLNRVCLMGVSDVPEVVLKKLKPIQNCPSNRWTDTCFKGSHSVRTMRQSKEGLFSTYTYNL